MCFQSFRSCRHLADGVHKTCRKYFNVITKNGKSSGGGKGRNHRPWKKYDDLELRFQSNVEEVLYVCVLCPVFLRINE